MTHYLDIACIPRRSFFELLSWFSPNELEREKLQEFSSAQGQEDLYAYCNRPRRTTLEVRGRQGSGGEWASFCSPCLGRRFSPPLEWMCFASVVETFPSPFSSQVLCDFPHTTCAIPSDYLLDLIPRIRPRAFSIASSMLVRKKFKPA